MLPAMNAAYCVADMPGMSELRLVESSVDCEFGVVIGDGLVGRSRLRLVRI